TPRLGLCLQGACQDRRDTGVSDPYIDATPFRYHAVGDGLVEVGVAHVPRELHGRPLERSRHCRNLPLSPGGERDARTSAGEGLGQQLAQPAPAAGDHYSLSGYVPWAGERVYLVDLFLHQPTLS